MAQRRAENKSASAGDAETVDLTAGDPRADTSEQEPNAGDPSEGGKKYANLPDGRRVLVAAYGDEMDLPDGAKLDK